MSKKVTITFIVLIAVLFLSCGGLGYLSYYLNNQINTLSDDTQVFKADTSNQFNVTKNSISGVDTKLSDFKSETSDQFSNVQNDISGLDSNLAAFKSDTASKFSTTQGSINALNSDLTAVGTQLNESTMNVRRVYEDVIGSVCYIYGPVPGGTACGSGFIYSVQGQVTNIITCWHVVESMSPIYVQLHDGSVVKATVVGSDQDSDVAVIKLTGKTGLMPLPLADSSTLVPGEPVIIVGNPLFIFETVVSGVISRVGGMVYVGGVGWVANLIQYDAAQNGGNSGGPVFNNEGQVIGIADNSNTVAEGVHRAVSSNKVKRVAEAILDTGSFTNSILPGMWAMDDLYPETAFDRGSDSSFGAIILFANCMGDVRVNDIIIAADGIMIKDTADLFSYIAEFKSPGDTIVLTLIRGSGTQIEESLVLNTGGLDR